MPTFNFSGGSASGGGFNMGMWNAGFILALLQDVNTTATGNATQATFSNPFTFGGTNTLVAQGSFANYTADGPQSGTVTGFQYTTYFTIGVPVVMSVSGISISVASLNNWAITDNQAALEAALFGGNDTFNGTAFADSIQGYGGDDTINAGDGDDTLGGDAGNDTLNGEGGNDYIVGWDGNDHINGGDGDDDLNGNNGADTINGGAGNDRFDSAGLGDVFDGGDGIDSFWTEASSANFTVNLTQIGSNAGVTLANGATVRNMEIFHIGSGYANAVLTVVGPIIGTGNTIDMPGSNSLLVLDLSTSSDVYNIFVVASDRYNIIGANGSVSANFVERLQVTRAGGADTFYGWMQGDTFDGGAGNDVAYGSYGNDNLIGGDGDDVLWGEGDNDNLSGGTGTDLLYGSWGADTLNGGTGIDTATFDVASTSATWTRNVNGSWTINAGSDGIDTATGVEVLHFTNRNVVLDNAQRTFFGNGTSDLLWRNANHGTVVIWDITGATQNSAAVAGGAPAEWQIIGTGDLNGDGRDDMLWRNTNDGGVAGWLMNGTTATSIAMVGGAPSEWQVAGIGDFNFDGRDDLVWRNSNDGSVAVWLMNGLGAHQDSIISGAPVDWAIAGIADLDGDGRDDILLRHTDGTLARWTTDGVTQTSASIIDYVPPEWQFAGAGDFDGDGRADILWRNTNDGGVAMWLMNGSSHISSGMVGAAPLAWSVSQIGDYNGDGRDDIVLRNDDGTVAIWIMNSVNVTNQLLLGVVPTDWELV